MPALDGLDGKAVPGMRGTGGSRWRELLVALAVAVLVAAGCGGDDDAGDVAADPDGSGGAVSIVTLADVGLDLPIELPGDLPVPSDVTYIGESEVADPYTAVLLATDMDQGEIDAAIEAYAASAGLGFEESIAQAQGPFDLSDGSYQVYIWSRFTDDTRLVVEIGRLLRP